MTRPSLRAYTIALFIASGGLFGCHDGDSVESARKKLTELQGALEQAAAADLNDTLDKVDDFRNSLPVLVAIELSPQLNELNWLAAIRQATWQDPTPISLLEAEGLLSEVPPGLRRVAPRLSEEHATQTITLCEQQLKSDSGAEANNSESKSGPGAKANDIDVLLGLVSRIDAGDPDSDDLAPLIESLRVRLQELTDQQTADDLKSQIASLHSQLEQAKSIADETLRTTMLDALRQNTDAIRLQVAMEKIVGLEQSLAEIHSQIASQLNASLQTMRREREETLEKAHMKYQAWSLDQIEQMNTVLEDKSITILEDKSINEALYFLRDEAAESQKPVKLNLAKYEGVRELFEQRLGKLNDDLTLTAAQRAKVSEVVSDSWYKLVYQFKHDAAVMFLLPINQGLLEPPVAKFYNEAFETTWQQIEDGDGLQLSLARKSAEVAKRTIQSFLEDSPQ